jgi:hypothetical protein
MADIENNSKHLNHLNNDIGEAYLKQVLKMNYGKTQRDRCGSC